MALAFDAVALTEYAAVLISVFFFVLGSVHDLRTREAPDKVWVAYGLLGLATTLIRLCFEPSVLYLTLFSIGITTLLSFGLFYFGLFGGADSKAVICLGLSIPLPPTDFQPIIGYAHPIFPLVAAILGFVCSANVALWYGIRNLATYAKEGSGMFEGLEKESRGRKLIAALTGYPAELSKLRSTFYLYPLEEITRDSSGEHRSLKLFYSAEVDRDKLITELAEGLSRVGYHGKVWVTPGLPMLVFILLGLIIALLLGDPIFGSVLLVAR